ncbi:MAG: hypothetical protein SGILL_009991 [Bacillariaceae sp.]
MCLGTHSHYRQQAPDRKTIEKSLIDAGAFKPDMRPLDVEMHEEIPVDHHHYRPKHARKSHAHIIVHHDYHDHSHDLDLAREDTAKARGGVVTPFPVKLHAMLDAVKQQGLEDVVSWQQHGRSFAIHKPKEFVELLSSYKYLKLSKLASFQRQLNLYGFQRITKGRDRNSYYHELFLRGKPHLAHNIQRLKVKGTGVRARANPAEEPDFWKMEWMDEDGVVISGGTPPLSDERNHKMKTSSHDAPATTSAPEVPSSLVFPGNLAVVPIVSPVGVRQSKLAPGSQAGMAHDNDVVCAFDRTFHYLDPFQPLPLPDVTPQSASNNPPVAAAPLSSAEAKDEAETFFKDFEFPENFPEIEDDTIFGEMLAKLIA